MLKINSNLKIANNKSRLGSFPNLLKKRKFASQPEKQPNLVSREDFFKYTWGTWLKDNEAKRNRRTTKFSLEGLEELVKSKIDKNATLKALSSLHEGKHHRVYSVQLSNGSDYVLRIPYQLGSAEARTNSIKSEVATIDFLRKKQGLKLPEVHSYSASKDNLLGIEYMLTDRAIGSTLMRRWLPTSAPEDKSIVLKPVVDILSKILETRFSKYGSLYFTEDVDAKLQNDLPYEGEKNSEFTDRWRIGPSTESIFWKSSEMIPKEFNRGPFNTPNEYYNAIADIQIERYKLSKNFTNAKNALRVYEKFKSACNNLFLAEDFPENSDYFAPRLYNPDLHPLNIIHQENDSYVLVDLEQSSIRPLINHSPPEFVRYSGTFIQSADDIKNYDSLSEEMKQQVSYMIHRTENQQLFYKFVSEALPKIIGIFSPRYRNAREVFDLASLVPKSNEFLDLEHEMIKLSLLWSTTISSNRVSPLKFDGDEIKQHEKQFEEWNAKIANTPFYSTGGWVPQDLFDEMLSTGELRKLPDGNYGIKGMEG